MDRTEDILSWWQHQQGLFDDLGQVLPFVVIDKVPLVTDRAPTPLMIGAQTLQRSLLDTADPRVFQEILAGQQQSVLDQVMIDQARVVDTWAPLRSSFTRSYSIEGAAISLSYDRLLLPIRMRDGRRMIFTHTTRNTRH